MRSILKKRSVRFFLFCASAFTMFYALNCILCMKSPHGVNQARYLYYQPKDTVDVLFLGSSHVHCNVNTAILWREHGIAAYLCTGAEQPLWNSYYYLVEALKSQSPSVVVLDMFCPVRFRDDYQMKWADQNLDGMRLSWTKAQAVEASVNDGKAEFLLDFPKYHARYTSLQPSDFENFFWNRREQARWKGFTPLTAREALKEPDVKAVDGTIPMTEKSGYYFDRIVSLTRKKGIALVLVAAPYPVTPEDQKGYNKIAALAKELGIPFLNYNSAAMYRRVGLDFGEDFADPSHLNERGSAKYTEHLGWWLAGHCPVPDRRGQEGYESWAGQIYG